jgi:hypothetical protein
VRGYRDEMGRRTATALAVFAVGSVISVWGGTDGKPAEFPAFALLAVCAFVFMSRTGTLITFAVIAILSASNNYSQSSEGITAREIGSFMLLFLLIAIVVIGAVVDLVLRLTWRSTRSLPPGA